jgi:protease-4
MKAALQSRMQIEYRVLVVASILTLSVFLIGQPAMLANASPTTAKESSKEATKDKDEDEDEDADSKEVKKDEKKEDKKEEKSGSSVSKSTNGKADHKEKESEKHSASSSESKSKATAAKHESEKAKGEKVRVAMLTLKDTLPESAEQAGPFSENKLDMRELNSRLEKAAKDKTIAGLILDIQNPTIGRGKVDELRGAISRFRKSGKKVYAMMDSAEPSDYLVACACDEIVMPETGVVTLPGIHAEATFYKGLLAKLGIEADFIHIGEFKGYAEAYTRDKFSDPVRENMTKLIDDLYDDMVTTIVKDRPLTISQAKEIIDTGMVTAGRAKDLGLIDRVAYPDGLREELAKKYKAEPMVFVKNYGKKEVDTDFSGPMGFFKLMQTMMGGESSTSERKGKKIAVIYCLGQIVTGKGESGFMGDESMGSTTIIEAIRKANEDKNVVAIVLRVDSPGGSALASDLIWHETQVVKKPIVASMGDVAASGGYYISMGAKKIFAAPSTITGSIGVVGGKMALTGLFNKVGITTETIERGKNSGIFSSSGKFTDSQREVVKKMMEDMYVQFTTKAATGRHMPVENLRKLAGGRVYSGRQAKENGLIDELGTLHDAVAEAKKLAGLDSSTEVRIEVLPEPTNFLESLFGNLDSEKETRISQGLNSVAPELVSLARRAARLRSIFERPVAFMMPFELDIK